jgi:hypothetical protein
MLAEYSALADSSVSSFSSLKPVVNPFPDVRYNVFDPKPTMPHHRSDTVILLSLVFPLARYVSCVTCMRCRYVHNSLVIFLILYVFFSLQGGQKGN